MLSSSRPSLRRWRCGPVRDPSESCATSRTCRCRPRTSRTCLPRTTPTTTTNVSTLFNSFNVSRLRNLALVELLLVFVDALVPLASLLRTQSVLVLLQQDLCNGNCSRPTVPHFAQRWVHVPYCREPRSTAMLVFIPGSRSSGSLSSCSSIRAIPSVDCTCTALNLKHTTGSNLF